MKLLSSSVSDSGAAASSVVVFFSSRTHFTASASNDALSEGPEGGEVAVDSLPAPALRLAVALVGGNGFRLRQRPRAHARDDEILRFCNLKTNPQKRGLDSDGYRDDR
nr:hypothetical protein Iba_chr05eCG0870 [Ipomoea batatas]